MWTMDVREWPERLLGFIFVFQLTKHAPAFGVRVETLQQFQPSNRNPDYDDQRLPVLINKRCRDERMGERRRSEARKTFFKVG